MSTVEMSSLFTVNYGNKFDLNKMAKVQEGVAFVNRTGFNNGVVAYVEEITNIKPYQSGVLTIALGGSVLSTFLQIDPFYTGQNVAVAIPKQQMSEGQLLYYATAIKANRFRYSTCGREANRTFRSLLVPALSDIPAWVNEANPCMFDGADAPAIPQEPPPLDAPDWKPFELQHLFKIDRGRGPRRKELSGQGTTPFVTSSDSNNGLTGFTSFAPTHKGNTIGVNRNGSVAESFYQSVPFCSTEDVHIFTPKFEMNPYIALFLATLIRREKYRFGYGRKWGIQRMKVSTIRLPVTATGEPDWALMETYIRSLPYSSQIQ